MAKSSYYYQKAAIKRHVKYREIHTNIIELFKENRTCYGYRRIHSELKKIRIDISEKIVRRIMKQSLGYMSPTEYRHSLGLTA